MRATSLLPWILLFPLAGFLINGLVYLLSHSKLGGKDSPKGPHGGHGPGADVGGSPHPPGPHDAAHGGGHGGHGAHGGLVHIPFAAVHSVVGPIACGLSFVTAMLAIFAWWGETHGEVPQVATLWSWLPMGDNPTWFGAKTIAVDVALRIDPLTALMLGFVTF